VHLRAPGRVAARPIQVEVAEDEFKRLLKAAAEKSRESLRLGERRGKEDASSASLLLTRCCFFALVTAARSVALTGPTV
jgi:hypothetical protein